MVKVPKKEIERDLDTFKKLDAILNQEGGKHLIKLLMGDIVVAIDTISGNYKELNHIELIAQSARLSERLSMYRLLKGARKNIDIIQEALDSSEESD